MIHNIDKIGQRFDAILFDLDGTLVETAPDLCGAMNYTLSTLGLPPLRLEEVHSLVGDGARAMVSRGLAKHNFEADIDALFDIFIAYYGDHIADESFVFDGLMPSIKALHEAGVKLAVCTNKPESLSRKLLAALSIDHYFGAIVGGDTLDVRKPDPEHILATLRQLDVRPDRALMVGDSANDVNAAKAANVPVIAVTFGYTDIPAHELGADQVIEHFDTFPAALAKLS